MLQELYKRKEVIKMDKEIIKVLLILMFIICYFANLVCMFEYEPLELLIANGCVWLIVILIFAGIAFTLWLNDW